MMALRKLTRSFHKSVVPSTVYGEIYEQKKDMLRSLKFSVFPMGFFSSVLELP